jgi:hypothetical protein
MPSLTQTKAALAPTPSPFESFQAPAEAFRTASINFARHLKDRIQEIRQVLDSHARLNSDLRQVFDRVWRARLRSLEDRAVGFERRAATRPTLCVMGKRGQGKTSLLQSWLGLPDVGGFDEVRRLPTGDQDTTACLIRLTRAVDGDPDRDVRVLHVDFIEGGIPNVPEERRPPRLPLPRLRLRRAVAEGVPADAAYTVCRFPIACKDDELFLKQVQAEYQLNVAGEEKLTAAQWNTRQVLMPLRVDGARGLAGRVLAVLDVVDAPGYDSQQQSEYPEWKQHKNTFVYQTATQELDVLLLVCSCNPDAMQLGPTFQEKIWGAWLQRCNGNGQGRLLLALTNAARLFKVADATLTHADNRQANQDSNFARSLFQNVLDAMRVQIGDFPPILDLNPATTWPPIFLFEQNDADLARYREGLTCRSWDEVAKQVSELAGQSAEARPTNLPLGMKCMLRLLDDWGEAGRLAQGPTRQVQHWLARALCALLDPKDRGYGLLTDWVTRYGTGGPVARRYVQERTDGAEQLSREFHDLLTSMREPGKSEVLDNLSRLQKLLAPWWRDHPEGPVLTVGTRSRKLRDQAKINARPIQASRREFDLAHLLCELVGDVVEQLSRQGLAIADVEPILRRSVEDCLRSDWVLADMARRWSDLLDSDRETLERLQAVALERSVRVLHYLATTDPAGLRKVAQHCAGHDVAETDLLRPLLEQRLLEDRPPDRDGLQRMKQTAGTLQKVIDTIGCPSAY